MDKISSSIYVYYSILGHFRQILMERVRGEMCSVVVVPFSLSYIPTKSTNQSSTVI